MGLNNKKYVIFHHQFSNTLVEIYIADSLNDETVETSMGYSPDIHFQFTQYSFWPVMLYVYYLRNYMY